MQRLLYWLLLLQPLCLPAQKAGRFDVLITELFPDPSPAIGLPENEFIELKNVAARTINLRGWKLSDGTSAATINVNVELPPDSIVIICPNAAVASFTPFGRTVGVTSFPSLNNEGDIISLYSPEGSLVHSVAYNSQWYNNVVKEEGGWTLEMMDIHNPCNGAGNWKVSIHTSGGTPGRENSVVGNNPDNMPPALLRTYTPDSITIVAVFDEPLDSTGAANAGRYTLNNNIGHPIAAIPVAPLFNEVTLKLSQPLKVSTVYELSATAVTDCSGNVLGMLNKAKAGWPVSADTHTLAINELLFDPPSGGYDYIELYNYSNTVIDLKQLYIANRSAAGALSNSKQLSTVPRLWFPGEYIVVTEDSRWLQEHYNVKDPATVIVLAALPSMPDDKGTVVVLNQQGAVVEELQYDSKWHFALLSNKEGVALERISYREPSQNNNNWMSAAAAAGFGTPGYLNSQFRADLQANGTVFVTPSLFSPDNDGFDDLASVQYEVSEPGYVANITVFDAAGRQVRHLVRSATLAKQGIFRWDGLDDQQRKLPVGVYIVFTELFNLQGKTKKFRNTVTLIRHL
jgi:hypothetical protein